MRGDLELLIAWRDGSNAAGNALVDRYFGQVYGFFRSKVNPADVDDLTQRTFLRCTESVDRFRGDASFRTYLFAIARNELYQSFRARHRDALDFSELSVQDLGTSPSQQVARAEGKALVVAALQRIPLDQQVALELYFWEEMSGPEIAIVMDVPEGTARTWIRRGRQAVAAELERMTAGSSDADAGAFEAWLTALRRDAEG